MDDFISAVIPERCQIFGTELRPFSLGHHLILDWLDNGFLRGDGSVEDLIIGVIVCSQTYEEALAFLRADDRDAQVEAWSAKVKEQAEGVELDFTEKAKLFQTYVDDGRRIPVYSFEEGKGSGVGSPWWQILKVTLMGELGLSESDVLNRPLRLCWLDYLSWRELNGKGVRLVADVAHLMSEKAKADEFHAKTLAKMLTPESLIAAVDGRRNGT